ncbi:MAG: c-type cytochrome [Proteobacteria bacterium]|nr:c-type cytochrome [Pseudomonadota bacterium]
MKQLLNNLCTPLYLVFFATGLLAQEELELPISNASDYHEQGRAIYNFRCYFCHGYSGDARTLATTFVNPPPRDFTRAKDADLSRPQMLRAVKYGQPDTAMTGFSRVLNSQEIATVVDFIRVEFMLNKEINTRYHTPENGWPDHRRYAIAFPFATGEIPLDKPWEDLTARQVRGKQLFLTSCITCHDRSRVINEGDIWIKQSVSYPRNNYSHTRIDAVSSASIYAQHDISPELPSLSAKAGIGRLLWLENCAFCHAADGSGQNWIGSFLEPPPRDLRDPHFMAGMTIDLLIERIENGLVNTSMPAWRQVLSREQIGYIVSYISEAFHRVRE